MRPLAKKILQIIFIGLLVVVLLVGGVVVYAYSNQEQVRKFLVAEIKDNISGKVDIGAYQMNWLEGFPMLSAQFSDVSVTDSLFPVHGRKLLEAKRIAFQVNTWKLLFGRVSVEKIALEGVHVQLLKMANGYENTKILNFRPKESTSKNQEVPSLSIKQLEIRDLRFLLEDLGEGKRIEFSIIKASSYLSRSDTAVHFKLKGQAHSEGLIFLKVFGPYLAHADVGLDIQGYFSPAQQRIGFTGSKAILLGETYAIDGWISPSDTAVMDMHISSDVARLEKVVPFLTDTIANTLKKIQVTHPVKGHMRIYGKLIPKVDPHIFLTFSTKDNQISYEGMPLTLTGVGFEGKFKNDLDPEKNPSDPNSIMEINNFVGNIGSVPIKSSAVIQDFIHPKLSVKGHIEANLEDLDEYTYKLPVDNLTGNVLLDFDLKNEDIGNLVSAESIQRLQNFNGELKLDNVGFTYKSSESNIEGLNAVLSVEDNALEIKELKLIYSNNPLKLKGKFIGLIPYLIKPENALIANLEVFSEDFVVDYLLSKNAVIPKKRKNAKAKKLVIDKQTMLYAQNLHFRCKIQADKLRFKKLTATNVSALVDHTGEATIVRDISMNTLGGAINLSCKVSPLTGPKKFLTSNISIRSVDVNRLFYSFDNFNQKVIESNNVKGRFSAEIAYSATLKEDFSIDPSSMQGSFDFKLKKGELLDFEPLIKLSKFIFKRRQLDDISFDEIGNRVSLNGKDITIPDMAISTSAFSFFLKGNYNFDNIANLQIKVPLSNFLKWEPGLDKNIMYTDSTGADLLITAKTVGGKLKMGVGMSNIFKTGKKVEHRKKS